MSIPRSTTGDPGILTPDELAAVRRPYRRASLLPGRAYHDPAIAPARPKIRAQRSTHENPAASDPSQRVGARRAPTGIPRCG